MKAVKFLIKAVVAIVVLVVVAVLALPLWFGPVVKGVGNAAVPGVVKTDFNLAHLSLNPYTARFELGGLVLANPTGYSEKIAARVGELTFDAETLSLATDVIHIEEITVKDVFVSYVSGGENNVNNFKQIQYNVAGGKEKYEQAQAEKESAAKLEAPEAKRGGEKPAEAKPAKKVIIDKLTISGLKLQLGILPISLPSITLTDIGRKEGGATLADAWQQIVDGVLGAAGAVGDQAKALLGSVGDVSKQATEAVGKATESVNKAASQATAALGNVTGGATETAGKAAESATKAAGDAAKAAGDAVKSAGEGAKKALDSLKSLW